jgi:hypothetical protein
METFLINRLKCGCVENCLDKDSDDFLRLRAKPGDTVAFDAAGSSDPDKDELRYHWWIYSEAGRRPYGKAVSIEDDMAEEILLTIPADAAGKELHLILEVWDRSTIAPVVDYRRAIIEVGKTKAVSATKR